MSPEVSTELVKRPEVPQNDAPTVQVKRHKPFAAGKHDPSEMGKLGAAKREANALERIGKARDTLGRSAPQVARGIVKAALGDPISPVQLGAMNSVLDRTVGKAPTELRIGMADQTLTLLRQLELEE